MGLYLGNQKIGNLGETFSPLQLQGIPLSAAYDAAENKGAIIPEDKTAANLATCIDSIPAGEPVQATFAMTPNSSGILRGKPLSSIIDFTGVTTIEANQLQKVFKDVSLLPSQYSVKMPDVTLVSSYGCDYMFQNFTALSSFTGLDNLTSIGVYGCEGMFAGCSNLIQGPSILPATTLAGYCYNYMFASCTSISSAPALPALALAANCYQQMFQLCTNLSGDVYIYATSTSSTNAMTDMFRNITNTLTLHFKPAFQTILATMTGYPKFGATGTVNIVYDL